MSSPKQDSDGIDISQAAERIKREDDEKRRRYTELYRTAKSQLNQAVVFLQELPEVRRIITWGSILRPDRFTDISDIDICLEGEFTPERWSFIERTLLEIVTVPLDLVRWDLLMEPHRKQIMARGRVLYESD